LAGRHTDVARLLPDWGAISPDAGALSYAARIGEKEIVKLLVERGIDNHEIPRAMTEAAKFGNIEMICYLILAFASDLRTRLPEGPASRAACYAGHEDAVQLLLAEGADPNKGFPDANDPVFYDT
jgi:ankyrin repeat protein